MKRMKEENLFVPIIHKKKRTRIKYVYPDRTKKWQIVCNDKIISQHIEFIHAQEYVPRLFKQGRIDNNYEIVPTRKMNHEKPT
jgi:hypothetical protein